MDREQFTRARTLMGIIKGREITCRWIILCVAAPDGYQHAIVHERQLVIS